jgi:hypothetical protein
MEVPTPPETTVQALRYVPSAEGGCWQVRQGTDIQEVASLREFQHRAGMEQAASEALAQPGTWISVPCP